VFDCLLREVRKPLLDETLVVRRRELEALFDRFGDAEGVQLTPYTRGLLKARSWLKSRNVQLDGVIAKGLELSYLSGERAMLKVKHLRAADCVVGGFRYESKGRRVGSPPLGLYDDAGLLHHVGFTSAISDREKSALTAQLEKLVVPPGFTGDAPGAPSRWSTERSGEWQPLKPKLVAEVHYDHMTGNRFRHGTKFVRWRPDKAPRQCTFAQLQR
jgi:ATP-dependent DNA ligase